MLSFCIFILIVSISHSSTTSYCHISSEFVGYYFRPTVFVCVLLGNLLVFLSLNCDKVAGDLTWFFRFSIELVVQIMGVAAYMLWRCLVLGRCVLSIIPFLAVLNKVHSA